MNEAYAAVIDVADVKLALPGANVKENAMTAVCNGRIHFGTTSDTQVKLALNDALRYLVDDPRALPLRDSCGNRISPKNPFVLTSEECDFVLFNAQKLTPFANDLGAKMADFELSVYVYAAVNYRHDRCLTDEFHRLYKLLRGFAYEAYFEGERARKREKRAQRRATVLSNRGETRAITSNDNSIDARIAKFAAA